MRRRDQAATATARRGSTASRIGRWISAAPTHGGWFATLLDSALGCVVQSVQPYTTAELKIDIVRPLTDKVPPVRAESHIIHAWQRMATADARLTGSDGKLYAHGSTTCFIYDAK